MYFTLDRVSRVCSLRVFLSVYLSNVESILRYGGHVGSSQHSTTGYEKDPITRTIREAGHVGSSQHSTTGYEEGSYHSHNTRGRVMLAVHSISPWGMRRILSLAQYERQGHVGSSQHSTTGYEEGSYHSHNTRGRVMLAVHSISPWGMRRILSLAQYERQGHVGSSQHSTTGYEEGSYHSHNTRAGSCWQFTAFHHGV
ncbi:hypothetical protein J6590_073959 [Homalodisca vitripennis]|nr:hypothetical protein J6590_073959 [Homalodisca vitripennis]